MNNLDLHLNKLKNILLSNKYTHGYLRKKNINPFSINYLNLPVIEYKLKEKTEFNFLVKLFLLGDKISLEEIYYVFQKKQLDNLIENKLLFFSDNNTSISSCYRITPFKDFYFFSDFTITISPNANNKKSFYVVYPPSEDSLDLAETLITKNFESVLDLCTGSGIQAVNISQTSNKVTGIDINPNAVKCASMSASINQRENIFFIEGDLYKPLNSDKFDLIIANPPFVINNEKSALFRDGGAMGDELLKQILNELKNYITDNGFCQIVTFLTKSNKYSSEEYLQGIVDKNGYDCLTVVYGEYDIYQIAEGQYKNHIFNFNNYKNNIHKILDFMNLQNIKTIIYCLITIKNNGKGRYKKIYNATKLDIPVKTKEKIYRHYNII